MAPRDSLSHFNIVITDTNAFLYIYSLDLNLILKLLSMVMSVKYSNLTLRSNSRMFERVTNVGQIESQHVAIVFVVPFWCTTPINTQKNHLTT